MLKPGIKIVNVEIGKLNPAEYNPRKWTAQAIEDLKKSISEFGFVDPVIANSAPKRKNIVIGGHFRLFIAKELGYKSVPVVYVNITDERKEKALNLRLNKNNGDWDLLLLSKFDEDLLTEIGFDSAELDRIFKAGEDKDPDEAPTLRPATKIKAGDMFKLGEHRLMCGDATRAEDLERLMGDESADMVFTDPPYNVNYSGRGKNTRNKIENDNQTEAAFREFLLKTFHSYRQNSKPNAPLYTCYASRTHREFEDALNENNYEVKNQIIWVKTVASMGWGDYRWKHEPILYCKQRNAKAVGFYGDRMQYTEWRDEISDTELLKRVKAMIVKDEAGGSTVWHLSRETEYKHPTQKPVALIRIALYNSSKRGELVLDLFGGSGSTLIACETTNRRCATMELDPFYCQCILDRYEQFVGKKGLKIQ